MKPDMIVPLLLLLGGAQIIAGVFILAGIGWAVIALGILTLAFALLIARGAANAQ